MSEMPAVEFEVEKTAPRKYWVRCTKADGEVYLAYQGVIGEGWTFEKANQEANAYLQQWPELSCEVVEIDEAGHVIEPSQEEEGPTASFTVARVHLGQVQGKAMELGVDVDVQPMDPARLHVLWSRGSSRFVPWQRLQDSDPKKAERVRLAAEGYAEITLRAPAIEDRVIGVATLEGADDQNKPLIRFVGVPGEENIWGGDRIRDFTFARCDVCGAKHHRHKVFLVQHKDTGAIRQIGGVCASNLDLAKKLSKILKALKQFEAWLRDMGSEFEGGRCSSFHPGWDVYEVLVLAEMALTRHGYVSGKAAYENSGLVSTKETVAEWTGILHPVGQLTREKIRARDELQAEVEAFATKDVQKFYDEAKAFVDAKFTEDPTNEFASNLRTAFYTGSIKMLGFLVWIPAGLAKIRSQQAVRKSGPWTPSVPKTGAEFEAYCQEWDKETVLASLGIDEKKAAKEMARAEITKGLFSKIEKHVPGIWKVCRIGHYEGQFGTTYFFSLVREQDGAEITWKSSRGSTEDGGAIRENDRLLIDSATVGEIPPPRTGHNGKTYQDGRLIQRARVHTTL
jgi:hypothetical protein